MCISFAGSPAMVFYEHNKTYPVVNALDVIAKESLGNDSGNLFKHTTDIADFP